jgi:hypothetical protein
MAEDVSGGGAGIVHIDVEPIPLSLSVTDISGKPTFIDSKTGAIVPVPSKMTYGNVNRIIRGLHNDENTLRSTALDILAIYLKGQKILYTEAKVFCERRLNSLMIPAIVTTAICSILSLQLKDSSYGATVVSSLNGFNSLLLAMVSYLKLDAKAEAHKVAAYKFDKLQSYCEFKSGKLLFMNDEKENVIDIIDSVEGDVKEIKETNQFLLPEQIRYNFNRTFGTNVFTLVKEIQNEEMRLINRLKGKMNRLLELNASTHRNEMAILRIEGEQNAILQELIELRNKFLKVDKDFEEEIRMQIRRSRRDWNFLLKWLNT